jgi:PEP-CTERM motif
MLNRLALVVAVWVLVDTHRMVAANPITYDFTGTFQQPFDGSTAFSGSLTFNATPTLQDATLQGGGVAETGSDVSLTLNAGGQVFNFNNSPQNPTSSGVSVFPSSPLGTLPSVELSFGGRNSGAAGSGPAISFAVTMYDYGVAALPYSNLASLSFPAYTSSVQLQELTAGGAISGGVGGALTSFEAVSTPEPSTLVVFAGLGLAALLRRRCRGARGRGHRAQESPGS